MSDYSGYPRGFYITNAIGERAEMNAKNSFAYDPKGLGVELDYSLYPSMHGSTVATVAYGSQDLTFNLIFGFNGENYKDFNDFARIVSNPPLHLHYKVPYLGEYERKVVLKSLTKGDVDHSTGHLLSEMSLTPTSPWYRWDIVKPMHSTANYKDVKGYYDRTSYFGYPYPYKYASETLAAGWNLVVDNDSIIPGGSRYTGMKFEFTTDRITGPITNPSWSVLDMNYNTLQTEKLLMTIPMGYRLMVNTAYGEEEYSLYDLSAGTKEDITSAIDPTTRGFIQFPLGQSVFQVGAAFRQGIESVMDPHIGISIMKEWGVI